MAKWTKSAAQGQVTGKLFTWRHDRAIETLCIFLEVHDLYVVWPKRMTSMEEKHIERRNDEFFALCRRYREEMSRNRAIETAAEHCGYSRSRGYEIVELREEGAR